MTFVHTHPLLRTETATYTTCRIRLIFGVCTDDFDSPLLTPRHPRAPPTLFSVSPLTAFLRPELNVALLRLLRSLVSHIPNKASTGL